MDLKGVFHHTTQMQGWILIRDLFNLALEMCHPSNSILPPAQCVLLSSAQKS